MGEKVGILGNSVYKYEIYSRVCTQFLGSHGIL